MPATKAPEPEQLAALRNKFYRTPRLGEQAADGVSNADVLAELKAIRALLERSRWLPDTPEVRAIMRRLKDPS